MEIAEAKLVRGEVPHSFLKGYGYGYGSGYGDGYGYGSGYGDGSGYGYGSGYGDGSGYGSGYGSKEYWLGTVAHFARKMPEPQQARLAELKKQGAVVAFWRSDASGRACNGGSNKPVSPGTVETIKGPLKVCSERALHATFIPPKWKGDRWWLVAMIGETQEEGDKIGALTREVIGECV